jgi:AraC family transcriptional regulator
MNFPTLTPAAWLNALLSPTTRLTYTPKTYLGRWALRHWRIAPRTLDEHLMYWIVQGAAEGRVARETDAEQTPVSLAAGSFIWLMPGVAHAFWQAAGCHRLVLYNLRFTVIADRGRRPRLQANTLTAARSVELEPYIAAIVDELAATGGPGADTAYSQPFHKALVAQLAVQMLRASERPVDAPSTLNRFQRELLQRHVENHVVERIQPDDLARLCALSPDYFTRIFRRTFNLPPRAWILRQRIRLAAVALAQSTGNISQIARQLGYPDVYLFSRQFKQVMGMSPRRYRLNAGAPPPAGRTRP